MRRPPLPGILDPVPGFPTWPRRLLTEPPLRRRLALGLFVFGLSFVPMVGTLGYFSSFILAPLLSLLAAAAGVDAVAEGRASAALDAPAPATTPARARPGPETRGPLWTVVSSGARDLAWLLGLSLGLLILGQLWTTNCDPWGGALYFFMGPVCSTVLGWIAGVSAAIVVGARHRLVQLLAAWAPFLFCLGVGVRRLYADPVVYAYDPFWGWFSGPIYDEGVAIGPRYLLFRAYNFSAAAGVWLLLRASAGAELALFAHPEGEPWTTGLRRAIADGPNRLRTLTAAILLVGASGIGLTADRWGFTATVESISKVLGATRETEHFVIHYAPASATALEIDMVAADHEFAWHRLEARLGRSPDRKVHSFIFANGKLRQRAVGADRVEVSPPWRQQMYLSRRSWPHDVMPHELAHAFLGDFGDPLLGLPMTARRFNGGLIEGLPTALAPRPQDHLGLHEQAAILDRLDKRPPLQTIMGAGFWSASASRAYTAAGSFVLWLAEVHDPARGWAGPTDLYDNAGDLDAVYGRDLEDLEQEWVTFLRALPLREADIEAQAQRFQRQSVFRRPCAHRAAELNREASIATLLDQREEALEARQTLCRIEPDQPAHFIGLAHMLAQWGEFDDAAEVLDTLAARDDLSATYSARIEEQRGDTALVAGRQLGQVAGRQLELAANHYQTALDFGLSAARRRRLQIKLAAAEDPNLAPLVADYFRPFTPGTKTRADVLAPMWTALQIRALPGYAALGDYLVGRQFLIASSPGPAYEVLSRAHQARAPGPQNVGLWTSDLLGATRWALVSASVQTRRWDEARELLDLLEADALGTGDRGEVALWRERIEFFEHWFAAPERAP